MKITATLQQVNDSVPFFREMVNKNISYSVGYKLYNITEKLDKVIDYMKSRVEKEVEGITDQNEQAKIIHKILETKIEIDAEQIDRKEFLNAISSSETFPPIALSAISFILTSEGEDNESFKVIE